MDFDADFIIAKMLRVLQASLDPFVRSEYQVRYNDQWQQQALQVLQRRDWYPQSSVENLDFDIQALLDLMINRWNDVFASKLSQKYRNYAGLLVPIRNDWAHNKKLSKQELARAVDCAAQLLRPISATDADVLEQLHQAIQTRIATDESFMSPELQATDSQKLRNLLGTLSNPASDSTPSQAQAVPDIPAESRLVETLEAALAANDMREASILVDKMIITGGKLANEFANGRAIELFCQYEYRLLSNSIESRQWDLAALHFRRIRQYDSNYRDCADFMNMNPIPPWGCWPVMRIQHVPTSSKTVSASFSPSGNRLAALVRGSRVIVCEREKTGNAFRSIGEFSITFSPMKKRYAICDFNDTIAHHYIEFVDETVIVCQHELERLPRERITDHGIRYRPYHCSNLQLGEGSRAVQNSETIEVRENRYRFSSRITVGYLTIEARINNEQVDIRVLAQYPEWAKNEEMHAILTPTDVTSVSLSPDGLQAVTVGGYGVDVWGIRTLDRIIHQ